MNLNMQLLCELETSAVATFPKTTTAMTTAATIEGQISTTKIMWLMLLSLSAILLFENGRLISCKYLWQDRKSVV